MTQYELLQQATSDHRNYLLAAPIHQRVATGDIDLAAYHAFLANAYHHVRFTVPLMMAAASRLPSAEINLNNALFDYINEEHGHEHWILNDLEASGGSPQSVVRAGPSFECEMLVAYVRDYINQINPIGFFGMVYVLEGTSVALASATADLVQGALGLPDTAFSYLRSHGSLDIEHLHFFENLVNTLDEAQLEHVIHVAIRVFKLYGDVLRAIPTSTSSEQDHVASAMA